MTLEEVGRYQIESELGRGGMSTVYLAYDPNVDRRVAIKLLPREFLHHEEFRERFNREARIIAALEHSAIVPIYDFGDEGGQPYFVMRHMSGGSLSEQLKKGALSVEEAAAIVERIGSALQYAHSRGIVHRDLKPGNILFDQFKTAYLADFGIARLQETGATLTGTVFMGTPAYMSPEQVQASHELDGRADIYALGIILYEMLTGKKPYEAPTAAGLALKHVIAPVPHILDEDPTLPPDAEAIISKAMAKNPDDRYPTAIELTSDVNSLAAGQTIAIGKPPETEDAGQKEQGGKAAAVAAGAALAGAAVSAGPDAGPDDESAIEATAIAPAEMSAAVRAASAAQDTDDLKTTLAPAETPTAEVAGTAAATGAIEDTALMEPAATAAAAASTAAATPAGEEKKSRTGLIAILAVLVVLCLGAAAVAFLVGGDSLFGFFSSPTATATSTATTTATTEPTETSTATATVTATSTATATASATATEEPSATPTDSLAEPTLRPTLTPLPTNTFPPPTATFPPPTATNPPPATSAPQPPSPPQPTSPPPAPTSPPPAPTSPAVVDPGD